MKRKWFRRAIAGVTLSAVLGFGAFAVDAVNEQKPANAATYCSPYFNYDCYMRYTICGPFRWVQVGSSWYLADRCGIYM
jgi:hypothetical protein